MTNNRYFVTVNASSQGALRDLRDYNLMLFEESVRVRPPEERMQVQASEHTVLMIDGLLALEDIGQLVENGYTVLVKEVFSQREAHARIHVIEFDEWLKGMMEEH